MSDLKVMRALLKSIKSSKGIYDTGGTVDVVYDIVHSDGRTTLDQELWLKQNNNKWKAIVHLEDFPPQETADKAALKLVSWLRKLADSIEQGSMQGRFKKIKLDEL